MLPESKIATITSKGGRYISATKLKADYSIQLECPDCGITFNRKWSSIRTVGSVICFKCARSSAAKKRCNSESDVKSVIESAGAVYVSGYENAHSKLTLLCECGQEYSQSYSDFLSIQRAGRPARCPTCASRSVGQRQTLTLEQVTKRVFDTGCTLTGEYVDYTTPTTINCRLCKNDWSISIKDFTNNGTYACPKCTCNDHQSVGEQQLRDWLVEEGLSVEQSNRTLLNGREIDLIAKTHNRALCLEYNGVHYHTERYGRDSTYHLNKTLSSERAGIPLFHVWDVDWNTPTKRPTLQSMIRLKLGNVKHRIPGRKTTISIISPSDAKSFLNKYHLHGFVGASNHFGMFFDSQLVGVMSLGVPRFERTGEQTLELYRLAFKHDTVVMGGFEKFIKTLSNANLCKVLTSYVDRSFSQGHSYKRCGFKLEKITTPGYHYEKSGRLYSRHKFQKHKLASELPSFNPQATELVNMTNSGYSRLWDCGHFKFTLTFE